MFIVNGFLLGLTTGVFCLAWCIPALLPLILSKGRKIKQSFFLFLEFTFGRLIGYVLFGGLIGYLGLRIESEIIKKVNLGALVFLAVLLILYGIGCLKHKKLFCQFFKKAKFPILFGFLTGVNICPPFLLALSYVFDVGGVGKGILFFTSFFLATSLYFIPFIFLGFLGFKKIFQKVARIIAVFAGAFFLIYGLRGLFSANSCSTCLLNYQNQIGNYLPLVIFCLLFLVAIFLFFAKDKRNFLFRNLILLFSLIYFGFILKNAFCPIHTFQLFFIDGSKIVMNLIPFLFFLLPIVLVLLIKSKIYCNWLCPLGALQEFIFQSKRIFFKALAKLQRKASRRTNGHGLSEQSERESESESRVAISSPGKLTASFRATCQSPIIFKFKYFVLIIVILALLIFRQPILCGIDPFGALFGRFITMISIILLIILIILSIFIYRPWCKFFCPYGALLSLFKKFSLFNSKNHSSLRSEEPCYSLRAHSKNHSSLRSEEPCYSLRAHSKNHSSLRSSEPCYSLRAHSKNHSSLRSEEPCYSLRASKRGFAHNKTKK